MTTVTGTELSTGSIVSADGTRIGYLQTGHGPAVVLLHGSMESSRSHLQMAAALAGEFTVYLPDRRGRGMSGSYPADYSIRTEVEDLHAVMAAAGADMVFGVSASGLVALEAARTHPAIRKVAVYEPALLPAGTRHTQWLPRFDREMAEGKVSAALITSMIGLELAPPAMKVMPRTLLYEGSLLAEMAGTLDTFADVKAEVLLLGGSKGLGFLQPALDELARILPVSRRVEFAGLDHGGSADVSKANPKGRPEVVGAELRSFLAADSAGR